MKVKSRQTISTDTVIEVSREDLINALNASSDYDIPYNARVWVNCEKRNQFDIGEEGFVNICYTLKEDIPKEENEPIPF